MSCAPAAASVYASALPEPLAGWALRPGGTDLTDRALAACGLPPGAQLLDVGCGAGATLGHLRAKGYRVAGLEPSPVLLAEARRRNPGLALEPGWAEELPWPADSLDGILCECVLSLVEQPGRALAEFRRVLRPGGHLILSDLYDRDGQDARSGRWVMESLLEGHGFHLLLWEDHTRLLKEMAARLILAGADPEAFCAPKAARTGSCPRVASQGYCLLAARLDKSCQSLPAAPRAAESGDRDHG